MPVSGYNPANRYTVVADTRRRWSEDEKQAIIAEALRPGVNVSAIARRHGITPNLLFRWRKAALPEAKAAASPAFLPVTLTAPAKSRDRSWDQTTSDAPAADNRIEIELLNGRRVRVGPGADMGALKRILDIADERRP